MYIFHNIYVFVLITVKIKTKTRNTYNENREYKIFFFGFEVFFLNKRERKNT
jgi:hypothetical protein